MTTHTTLAAQSADTSPFAKTILMMSQSGPAAGAAPAGGRRYAIRGLLGEGGMGRVLEAEDRQFSRPVAVKELRRELTSQSARFAVEALVTGNLEHPGVPTVYERGVFENGSPFYAMKLVRGRTLEAAIADAKTLEDRLKLVPVVVRVAQTLAYAHEHGVVHRDVKPENVVVGRHGETVLLDWGIAKVRGLVTGDGPAGAALDESLRSGAHTRHGSVMGTPAYMAPEQAAGRTDEVDERTDVWALGAILYQILAGHGPYADATVANIVARATACDFVSIDQAAPRAPRALREICKRAMSRDAAERHRSADVLVADLEDQAARALATASSPIRIFVALVTTASLIGIALTLFFLWQHVASIREQGTVGLLIPPLAVAGCAVSIVEWRTRGRYKLGSLALGILAAVVLSGIFGTTADLGTALKYCSSEKIMSDPARFRAVMTAGVFESLGALGSATGLGALQALLWGVAQRRAKERT